MMQSPGGVLKKIVVKNYSNIPQENIWDGELFRSEPATSSKPVFSCEFEQNFQNSYSKEQT